MFLTMGYRGNGEKVTVTDDKYTLTTPGTHVVRATDDAGNYTEYTVTVNADYTWTEWVNDDNVVPIPWYMRQSVNADELQMTKLP